MFLTINNVLSASYKGRCMDSSGNGISTIPFEKPGDCANFYQCDNGRLLTRPCGVGTVFNPVHLVCDWPRNVVGCDGSNPVRQTTTGATTTGVVSTTTSTGASTTTSVPVTNAPTTTITAPTTTNSPDSCRNAAGNPISSIPFPKPGDCHNYYQCDNGRLLTRPCGVGTVFNPVHLVCDWPRNVVGCNGSIPPPTTTETTTTMDPMTSTQGPVTSPPPTVMPTANPNVPVILCPEVNDASGCSLRSSFICEFIKWRVGVNVWLKKFQEWGAQNGVQINSPSLVCPDLNIQCKNPQQLRQFKDMNNCLVAYCEDGLYLSGPDAQTWRTHFANWRKIYASWTAAQCNAQ
uniref:chondroitin proteoglycan 1-like isoform X2 n=1 Tax=Ciona intestinalis TaxID=7719 RepID=UPI00089DB8F1|nr:chondroitin proteoglycan 1-like isoform X2 [Ciona intestinalis]|eukprot:XP_018667681.1 chondroitin proteoglycan 1-like isoform X2 [Ciona intestinalis]